MLESLPIFIQWTLSAQEVTPPPPPPQGVIELFQTLQIWHFNEEQPTPRKLNHIQRIVHLFQFRNWL